MGEMPGGGHSPLYSLYGLTLASDFPFANRLMEGTGAPDLSFGVVEAPPGGGPEGEPVHASYSRLDSGESFIYVYRRDECYVLRFTEVADFYLRPESIVCHVLDPDHDYIVEIYLLGLVFSLWLELRGIPAMHASAVAVGGRAAVFLGTNSGGKSSLAAALMRDGHPLLTDDILPVERRGGEFEGHPGYPRMRMWPDQARHFLGRGEDLEIVHPAYSKRRVPVGGEDGLGDFHGKPAPLACFYLPERRDPTEWGTGTEFTSVPRAEALMALVGQSFAIHLVEGLGLQPRRFGLLSSLAATVPVRKVVYPDGYEHLPGVGRAIVDDLAGLSASRSEDGRA